MNEQNALSRYEEPSVSYVPQVNPVEKALFGGTEYVELRDRILARQPLIFVDTYDREWLYSLLARLRTDKKVIEKYGGPLRVFEHVEGLGRIDFDNKGIAPKAAKVHDFLFLGEYRANDILVLHGDSRLFWDNELSGWLRVIVSNDLNDAAGLENEYGTVSNGCFLYILVVGPNIPIPGELIPYSVRMTLSKPETGAIERIFDELANKGGHESFVNAQEKRGLCESLRGFARREIELILRYAFQETDDEYCGLRILKAKREMIRRTGFLKLIDADESDKNGQPKDETFAGLEELQKYLSKIGKLACLTENQQGCPAELLNGYGLRGLLLVGMPGCGKSMAAKSARYFINRNWPLIQLDVGRLLGKYVGESEANLRMALDIAERVSPCILWIDELEKAFSGLDSSDGTALRLFGSFLTWMQEKRKPVYVIATANNIDKLPDEFKRKGRFDEIFHILLPNEKERAKIFAFHLRRFRAADEIVDVSPERMGDDKFSELCSSLALESRYSHSEDRGFSGADIAAIVNAVAADAFVDASKICEARLKREISRYKESHLTQRDLMTHGASGEDIYKKTEQMLKGSGFRAATKE